MSRDLSQKAPKTVLLTIVSFLMISGLLRFGAVGIAVARDAQDIEEPTPVVVEMSGPAQQDLEVLLEQVRDRAERLMEWEIELADRQKTLDAAALAIEKNLVELKAAEEKLRSTVALVEGAAEDDVARLVAVYETMKPKTAVPLFGQMSPEFAAGFLGRMRPEAAAAIMAGLTSEHAYAISVILAGRNAGAPTQ